MECLQLPILLVFLNILVQHLHLHYTMQINLLKLVILHKSTHIKINRVVFDPQLKGIGIGESREIWIPVFKQVDAGRIITIRSGKMKRNWKPIKRPPANMKKYCR